MNKTLLKGVIFDVIETEHETKFKSQVVKSSNAVCIAATLDGTHFFTVEQYRFGIKQSLIEFPAGKIDPKETPLEAAHRELREEIGYTTNNLIFLGIIHPSPAMLSEVIYLYYAVDLSFVGQDLDEDEELVVSTMSLQEIKEKILNNEISDSKTINLMYQLENYLEQK